MIPGLIGNLLTVARYLEIIAGVELTITNPSTLITMTAK